MNPKLIYHITTAAAWQAAQIMGEYTAESLNTQGFIHFSTRDQVIRVANAIYRGQHGLVLMRVKVEQLKCELKYEPPDSQIPTEHYTGELFPHLYGAVNLDAVEGIIDLVPSSDGTFALPEEY